MTDLYPTSGFLAACPRLTELTVAFPRSYRGQVMEGGILPDPAERAHSAMSELVLACKALPDFDTLQIVRTLIVPPDLVCWCGRRDCSRHGPSEEQWEHTLEKRAKDLEEWAVVCLKKPRTGCQEGERRRTTLRIIKFGPSHWSAKVEAQVLESEDP